jgi:hypothetical protein
VLADNIIPNWAVFNAMGFSLRCAHNLLTRHEATEQYVTRFSFEIPLCKRPANTHKSRVFSFAGSYWHVSVDIDKEDENEVCLFLHRMAVHHVRDHNEHMELAGTSRPLFPLSLYVCLKN